MKRLFYTMLAVCLLVLLALPAGAAERDTAFSDQAEIRNGYAVQMLVELELIGGYKDGSFRPGAPITRAETAKLIAFFCTDTPEPASWVSFADTNDSWAKDYIAYCAGEGIVGGSGGLFRPKDNVTAQELAKMLLVILGQDPETYSGAGWAERVNADAQSFGIYYGLTAQVSQPVTRDNACLLIYNAMRCPAIADPDAQGLDRYVLDDLMNPRSYLEVRYDLTRYTAVLTGNEYADLTTNDGKLAAGTTKLAGHKDFAVSSDLSLLGRTVDIYMKDGRVVGIPCYVTSEVYYTFENAQALSKLLSGGALTIADDAQYYLNYNEAGSEILTRSGVRLTVIDHDNDTQLDTILAVNCEQAEISSVSPLRVKVGDEELDAEKYCLTDVFSAGERVWYMEIGGQGFVQPRSET